MVNGFRDDLSSGEIVSEFSRLPMWDLVEYSLRGELGTSNLLTVVIPKCHCESPRRAYRRH
jgi:hypothetical protein